MDEYYPSTNIDTEIIVISVAKEVSKSQDEILFNIRKRFESIPKQEPVIQWAESPSNVYLQVRLHQQVENQICK